MKHQRKTKDGVLVQWDFDQAKCLFIVAGQDVEIALTSHQAIGQVNSIEKMTVAKLLKLEDQGLAEQIRNKVAQRKLMRSQARRFFKVFR